MMPDSRKFKEKAGGYDYQLLFFAREPGELIAGAAAMIMKEEDNKNGHTDAACNKGK